MVKLFFVYCFTTPRHHINKYWKPKDTVINTENQKIQSLHYCLFQLLVLLFASEEIFLVLWNLEVHHCSIGNCVGSGYMEFGIPKKLIRLIKTCLTETYSRVRVGKNLSDMFPIRNGLKQVDALSPLLFNTALQYAITRVQVNQDGFKLNGTHQLLACADDDYGGKHTYGKEKHRSSSICY